MKGDAQRQNRSSLADRIYGIRGRLLRLSLRSLVSLLVARILASGGQASLMLGANYASFVPKIANLVLSGSSTEWEQMYAG